MTARDTSQQGETPERTRDPDTRILLQWETSDGGYDGAEQVDMEEAIAAFKAIQSPWKCLVVAEEQTK